MRTGRGTEGGKERIGERASNKREGLSIKERRLLNGRERGEDPEVRGKEEEDKENEAGTEGRDEVNRRDS